MMGRKEKESRGLKTDFDTALLLYLNCQRQNMGEGIGISDNFAQLLCLLKAMLYTVILSP